MRFAVAALALVLVKCPHSDDHPANAENDSSAYNASTVGNPRDDIEFEITATDQSSDVVLHEGDPLPLLFPPQGGRVSFVGVRAKNIDPCGVQLSGALRDEATMQVRLDARTVNLVPHDDGWATTGPPTQISSYSNIPTCPNQWASKDIFDQTFAVTHVLLAISLFVAITGIFLALTILITERRRELAILRAIGASAGQIRKLLLSETAMLGALAAVIGLASGICLSLVLTGVINRAFFGWTIHLAFPWRTLLFTPVWILAAAILAGIVPAWRASRMALADNLRDE